MALTRKHFQEIADVLCNVGASKRIVDGFSGYFKHQNPRFNATRFEDAVARCKRKRKKGLSGSRCRW